MSKKKPLVAVMGVDGSGKSTVMEAIQAEFEAQGKAPIYILPRSKRSRSSGKKVEDREISHHALPPYDMVVSIGKLFYKGLQWVKSYYTEIGKLRKKGTIVLGDHFYFYYLAIDPLRFRYGGPIGLAWLMTKWLPGPDASILLKVDFEVVNARKQELTDEALRHLIVAHDDLMTRIPNGYVVDANQPLEEVVREVTKIIEAV